MNDLDKIMMGIATIARGLAQIDEVSEPFKENMRKMAAEMEEYALRNKGGRTLTTGTFGEGDDK